MTMNQDRFVDYALGILPANEHKQVEMHLKSHPHDAAQVRDYLDALTALVLSQEPDVILKDAEVKLLERIRAETSVSNHQSNIIKLCKRQNWQVWTSFAAAAVITGVAWFGFLQPVYQNFRIHQRLQHVQSQAGAVHEVLLSDINKPIGTLVRLVDNCLFVVLDEKPAKEQVYQGWEIAGGVPVSLGTWQGRMLEIQPLASGSTFGITLEPLGGSPQPTSTPIVLYAL